MKNYENIYILKGSLTEEQAKKEIEEITKYFESVKTLKKENDVNGFLGKKKLAYEIKSEITGYYYMTYFEGTESKVEKIENQLRLNDNVIKFITIRF
ncbi:MAG: 30S ribosomal protein S6 [Clostridia bacterium]|jgi:small subunit ribosomal protein S6|nr:30S ribosomal protein S6 [Clostridia bacterium]